MYSSQASGARCEYLCPQNFYAAPLRSIPLGLTLLRQNSAIPYIYVHCLNHSERAPPEEKIGRTEWFRFTAIMVSPQPSQPQPGIVCLAALPLLLAFLWPPLPPPRDLLDSNSFLRLFPLPAFVGLVTSKSSSESSLPSSQDPVLMLSLLAS